MYTINGHILNTYSLINEVYAHEQSGQQAEGPSVAIKQNPAQVLPKPKEQMQMLILTPVLKIRNAWIESCSFVLTIEQGVSRQKLAGLE
jgi:hypothetical protein